MSAAFEIPRDSDFFAIIDALEEDSLETRGSRSSSLSDSTFRELTCSTGEVSDYTADSPHSSEESDDSMDDNESLTTGIDDEVPGRWVTASLVDFVIRDLEEQRIDSLPLRSGFAKDYYSRLQLADSNLSLLISRAHVGISNKKLLDGRDVFYSVDESILSCLWALLVCVKITCVRKARRWATLCYFAETWRETEKCFFRQTSSRTAADSRKEECHSSPRLVSNQAISEDDFADDAVGDQPQFVDTHCPVSHRQQILEERTAKLGQRTYYGIRTSPPGESFRGHRTKSQ